MLKFYPKILYKINDYDYLKVSDISFYAKIRDFVRTFGLSNGRKYTIQDGDAPAIVSHKIYDTSRFDYSILILNNIRNLYDEWPRSDLAFKEYIEAKYGSVDTAKNTQLNFYRSDRKQVSRETWFQLTDSGKYFETIYDYELKLNDQKAKIRLLDYTTILSFEVELRQLTSKLIAEEIQKTQK